MSKRTVFTTVTPLPTNVTRETVIETLHSHSEMIDLNPLVEERHPIKPPPDANPEEFHCMWYSLTDRLQYLPGGLVTGKVTYNACFHDLERGVQTHCYAPMGLNIKGKWTLCGSLPGEPIAPVELGLGAPLHGLYLREDVDMKCNIMMTSFVKKTIKKAHAALVARLLVKSQLLDATLNNQRIANNTLAKIPSKFSGSQPTIDYSPSDYGDSPNGSAAPQFSPLQGVGFRGPETAEYRDRTSQYDPSLYPQALNIRNSISSHNGSIGSQSSYQEGLHGYHDVSHERRASWQNPNQNRSPSCQQHRPSNSRGSSIQQVDVAYQNASPYRTSPKFQHAELSDRGSLNRPAPQFVQRVNGYHTPPPQFGHAELE